MTGPPPESVLWEYSESWATPQVTQRGTTGPAARVTPIRAPTGAEQQGNPQGERTAGPKAPGPTSVGCVLTLGQHVVYLLSSSKTFPRRT